MTTAQSMSPVEAQLRATLARRIMILDGAMGTMLQDAGLTDGGAPEARAIARELGWEERRCHSMEMVGLIHYIGKLAIPAEILIKPAALTANQKAFASMAAQQAANEAAQQQAMLAASFAHQVI